MALSSSYRLPLESVAVTLPALSAVASALILTVRLPVRAVSTPRPPSRAGVGASPTSPWPGEDPQSTIHSAGARSPAAAAPAPLLVAFQKARPSRDSTVSAELGTPGTGGDGARPFVGPGLPSLVPSEAPVGSTDIVHPPVPPPDPP